MMNDSTLDYWIRTIYYEVQAPFAVAYYAVRNFMRTLDPFFALSTVAAISLLVAVWLIPVLIVRVAIRRQEGDGQIPTTPAGKARRA